MPSSHLILYRPLLLLPSIPPSIRVSIPSYRYTKSYAKSSLLLEFLEHYKQTPKVGVMLLPKQ